MALRTQALAGACLTLTLQAWAELRFQVRHDHVWKSGQGTIWVREEGLAYQEIGKPAHSRRWVWEDIQQLEVAPRRLRVLTYEDVRWKFGRDREHRFDLIESGSFQELWRLLRNRLDQRLVAALADVEAPAFWEAPAKRLRRFGGDQGKLAANEHGLVFETVAPGASRTWRWQDIESVSRTGPFDLTVTTYERALLDYGSRKSFHFQLKRPLEESQYRELWLRVNQTQGLKLLSIYERGERQP